MEENNLMPHRILYVNTAGGLGGAERVLLGILRACRDAFPESEIILLIFEDGPLREHAEPHVDQVIVSQMPTRLANVGDAGLAGNSKWKKWFSLAGQLASGAGSFGAWTRKLRRQVAELSPDLIHSNGIKAHIVTSWIKPPKVPLIWHLHDFLGQRRFAKYLLKVAAKRLSLGLAISEAVRLDFEKSVGDQPVKVLPNLIDTDRFFPGSDEESRERLRAFSANPGNFPKDVVHIGLVAAFATWKGHYLFLDSIAEVKRRSPSNLIRWFIIGGPIYRTQNSQLTREMLESYAADLDILDQVTFVPFQSEMPKIYSALDVVVHASTQPEPFGLTILEGMASGKAVISTAMGGAGEIFHDGEEGIALPECTPGALATAVLRLADDESFRLKLAAQARDAAVDRFDQRRLAGRLQAIYSEFVSQEQTTESVTLHAG